MALPPRRCHHALNGLAAKGLTSLACWHLAGHKIELRVTAQDVRVSIVAKRLLSLIRTI